MAAHAITSLDGPDRRRAPWRLQWPQHTVGTAGGWILATAPIIAISGAWALADGLLPAQASVQRQGAARDSPREEGDYQRTSPVTAVCP